MKRLEFEMQRLELEQQLEDMRERMAREKKTRQQDVAHEQWVTEQKRNLQAIKIEKVSHTTDLPSSRPEQLNVSPFLRGEGDIFRVTNRRNSQPHRWKQLTA